MRKSKEPIILVHRLLLLFSDVQCLLDPPIQPDAFSVNHVGMNSYYDTVERDDMVSDCKPLLHRLLDHIVSNWICSKEGNSSCL